jgi:AcrR family transcriptional regulator
MLDKILEGCERLFRKFGIKSLGMDDIARELGMSKKTIYQYVTDKNDLVIKTFSRILSCNKSRCLNIGEESSNPIEEILLITREMSQQMKGTNPSIFFDLRKYHPEAWQLFSSFNNEFVLVQIGQNLAKGKKQELYRSDINEEVISRIYISMLQIITNPDLFSNMDYEFTTVYNEMIRYHFYGICTPKGITFFEANFNNPK